MSEPRNKKQVFQEEKISAKLIAKKDFVINFNDYHREIKIGEDVSDIPKEFLTNLKTEGVI